MANINKSNRKDVMKKTIIAVIITAASYNACALDLITTSNNDVFDANVINDKLITNNASMYDSTVSNFDDLKFGESWYYPVASRNIFSNINTKNIDGAAVFTDVTSQSNVFYNSNVKYINGTTSDDDKFYNSSVVFDRSSPTNVYAENSNITLSGGTQFKELMSVKDSQVNFISNTSSLHTGTLTMDGKSTLLIGGTDNTTISKAILSNDSKLIVGDENGNGHLSTYWFSGSDGIIINTQFKKSSPFGLISFNAGNSIDDGNYKITYNEIGDINGVKKGDEKAIMFSYDREHDYSFSLTNNVEISGYEFSLIKRADRYGYLTYFLVSGKDYIEDDTGTTEPTTPDEPSNPDEPVTPVTPEDPVNPVGPVNPGKPTITTTSDAAVNALASTYLVNFSEIQAINDRMRNVENGQKGVWGRISKGQFGSFGDELLSGFKLNYTSLQIGVDKLLEVNSNDNFAYGASVNYTDGSVNYNRSGNGDIKSYSANLYFTYFTNDGLYNDTIFKYSRMNNKFSVKNTSNDDVGGRATMNAYTISNETGKKIYFNEEKTGLNITPFSQLIVTKFDESNYTTTSNLDVSLKSHSSIVGKVGSYISYDFEDKSNIYTKVGLVHEFDGKMDYTLGRVNSESLDLSGNFIEYKLGANLNINDNSLLQIEGMFIAGSKFNQKQVSVTYRYSF